MQNTCQDVRWKPGTVIEPLVRSWYAWVHLIAPVTHALQSVNSHRRNMASFVAEPELHEAALRNPAMLGGPFVRYPAHRRAEIARSLQDLDRGLGDCIGLVQGMSALEELLGRLPSGGSLEELYPQVPEVLRGYVELVYDLQHRPSFRVFETLLYRSKFYKPELQHAVMYCQQRDERPFALSSPRLMESGDVPIPFGFADERWDALGKLRDVPMPLGRVAELLESTPEAIASCVGPDQPAVEVPGAKSRGIRVRYFGHACVLVESPEGSVLIDPLIAYRPEGATCARFGFDDLPARIDCVLITHGHQDHFVLEHLLQLRHKCEAVVVPKSNRGAIADPSLRLALNACGFRNVIELEEMETLPVGGMQVTAVPFLGEHGGLHILAKAGYQVEIAGRRLLFLADANNVASEVYRELRNDDGGLEAMFLGMECVGAPLTWLYGPLFAKPIPRKIDQARRLDGSDSTKAIALLEYLKPKRAFVYAMGTEPWVTFVSATREHDDSEQARQSARFVYEARARGFHAERLRNRMEMVIEH